MMFKTKAAPAKPVESVMMPVARAMPKQAGVPTIISPDMAVSGNFKSPGDLQVEGVVTGNIEVGKLVIAQGGVVTGDVIAREIRVCGTLHGNLRGQMVTLTASAVMTGDVHHELLAIETGARLEGQVRRLQEAAPLTIAQEAVLEPA